MTARRRLVLTPIGDDPEIGRWLAAHVLQHEAEHRSHIAWLRDAYPALTPSR